VDDNNKIFMTEFQQVKQKEDNGSCEISDIRRDFNEKIFRIEDHIAKFDEETVRS
jgi:hypothetical protein